jgi:GcrA cell cycle regulator
MSNPSTARKPWNWTHETVALLRLYWAEGFSTAQIGRRLGCGKNAVVGKAHRLGLSPRPSPIGAGEANAAAKLNTAAVAEIRALHVPHDRRFGSSALAARFGVSARTIAAAAAGRTWV